MSNKTEKLERLSARLDENSQKQVAYLIEFGYGPTDLIREGIDLLYKKTTNANIPTIPALLKTLAKTSGEGPSDLSTHHKKYYAELLIEKHIG